MNGVLRSSVASVCAMVALLAGAAFAQAQRARWAQEKTGPLYADLPFVLVVAVDGFDASPKPAQPKVEIAGCTVTPGGVSVEESESFDFQTRRVYRNVRFSLRYEIKASRPGTYRVPTVTVIQGGKKVTASGGTFTVRDLATTPNLRLRVNVPSRPVWVGESFPVTIDWFLPQRPRLGLPGHLFEIPLFAQEDWVEVSPGKADPDQDTVAFKVGNGAIKLPLEVGSETVGGTTLARLRFTAQVIPIKAGVLELAPARVITQLSRGFRSELFKAMDVGRKLDIRAPPASGRPASFSNAVGSDYSIAVQTKRSFVRVGDPIELEITIRGNGPLSRLILPPLDGPGGLPKKSFSVPADAPVGEMIDKGAAKRFAVVVRLKEPVAGIPQLPFSYFDPRAGIYKTVHSQKIALQVAGSTVVSAADVVNTTARKTRGKGADPTFKIENSQLALSNPARTLRKATSVGALRPFLYALYALPVLLLLFRLFWLRTREQRGDSSVVRQRRSALETALARAASAPARDTVAEVATALRQLARATQASLRDADELLERLESAGFDPKRADEPVDSTLIAEIRELGQRWAKQRKRAGTAAATVALLLAGLASFLTPRTASAAGVTIDQARAAYNEAISQTNRDARRRGFARAERMFRTLVAEHPNRPELLTDWGHAALGAHELGIATLAYRRALRHDPSLQRARSNLAWIRDRNKAEKKSSKSIADTLFFWHSSMTVPSRHLVAAIAFALAILLLTPWGWHPTLLRRLAGLPALICVAMLVSVLLEPDRSDEAVVVTDEVVVRASDSPAAPAVADPIAAGAEAIVLEKRGAWTQVRLTNGTTGWVPTTTVKLVGTE